MRLWRKQGWGSVIIEAQAAAYGLPMQFVAVDDPIGDTDDRAALLGVSQMGQIPVLELDDGQIMTESAAITLYLADLTGSDLFVPFATAPERATFLRWLIWMVGAVYPCATFGDYPDRFLDDPDAAEALRRGVVDYEKWLFRIAEAQAGAPWFLGDRFSAIDVYLAAMVNWRPGPDWFAAEAPKLSAIANGVAARPDMAAVFADNFPD